MSSVTKRQIFAFVSSFESVVFNMNSPHFWRGYLLQNPLLFFKSILTLKYWLLELRSISFSRRISEAKARCEWKVDLIVKRQQNEWYFQHCKIIQILNLNFRPLRPFKISIVVTKLNCSWNWYKRINSV